MRPEERIILSLDGFVTIGEALTAVEALGVRGTIVKANDLLDEYGVRAAEFFVVKGLRLFADMKILDIPTTAARRTKRWRDAGADFLTVHASGCDEMIQACVEAAGERMKILAVTVLTSLDHIASMHVFGCSPARAVGDLAFAAFTAGTHGIVASAEELYELDKLKKINCLPPLVVTPGIRPDWAAKDDQKRTATPAEAIRAGADYLVIGRPIFKPPPEIGSPKEAFARIVEEIKSAEK